MSWGLYFLLLDSVLLLLLTVCFRYCGADSMLESLSAGFVDTADDKIDEQRGASGQREPDRLEQLLVAYKSPASYWCSLSIRRPLRRLSLHDPTVLPHFCTALALHCLPASTRPRCASCDRYVFSWRSVPNLFTVLFSKAGLDFGRLDWIPPALLVGPFGRMFKTCVGRSRYKAFPWLCIRSLS